MQFIVARQKWDKEFLQIPLLTVHRSGREEALQRLLARVSAGVAKDVVHTPSPLPQFINVGQAFRSEHVPESTVKALLFFLKRKGFP